MTSAENDMSASDARLLAEKPVYVVPREMRAEYLAHRRSELDALISSAKGNEWKYVITIAHNVRGTGRMYGFDNIGDAAEELHKAIQNADSNCYRFVEKYETAVREAYV